jgi:hypothetical protein
VTESIKYIAVAAEFSKSALRTRLSLRKTPNTLVFRPAIIGLCCAAPNPLTNLNFGVRIVNEIFLVSFCLPQIYYSKYLRYHLHSGLSGHALTKLLQLKTSPRIFKELGPTQRFDNAIDTSGHHHVFPYNPHILLPSPDRRDGTLRRRPRQQREVQQGNKGDENGTR